MQTIVVRTTGISADAIEPNLRVVTRCPATDKLAIRSDRDPLSVPGGQATWWHCSACKGWHVSVEDK